VMGDVAKGIKNFKSGMATDADKDAPAVDDKKPIDSVGDSAAKSESENKQG
jgi:Sec-independent protein translocase protein TatA